MIRLGAAWLLLQMLTAPALAQQPLDPADDIEQALARCHDGIHPIEDPSVELHTISFRAGPRDLRVFFGHVSVAYDEVGPIGRNNRREARLTLTCGRAVACVWSGPWNAALAAARDEHGIALLSALPLHQASLALHCPDLRSAQALHKALLAMQHALAH